MAGGRLIRIPPKYQQKEAPPDNSGSWVHRVVGPAARETLRFLQDLSYKIPYQDFLNLKVQVFERCRALAISDEFEDLTDDDRLEMLRTNRSLEYYRELPEYAVMRERLRAFAQTIYSDHDKDGKDWLEENKAIAQREMIRLIRDGADTSPGASKIVQEIAERVLPAKASRTMAEGAVIRATPEFEDLLKNALDVTARAAATEGVDKKPEGSAS